MTAIIFVVAVFNVALGYGLALVLHRPGGLLSHGLELSLDWLPDWTWPWSGRGADETSVTVPAVAPKAPQPPAPQEPTVFEPPPAVAPELLAAVGDESSEDLHESIGHALSSMLTSSPADGVLPQAADAAAEPLDSELPKAIADVVNEWRPTDNASPLSLALVALDSPEQIDAQHGEQTLRQVLRTLERTVHRSLDDTQLVTPADDQQSFWITLPGASPRDGVLTLERIRQQVQATTFEMPDGSLQVSVSCAVAAVKRETSAPSVTRQVLEALAEAKRYGGNRTFFLDGMHAAPAAPPPLKIEPEIVRLVGETTAAAQSS